MAMADGYTGLLLRKEVKELYIATKKAVEKDVGVPMTHSQAVEYMCNVINKILSDSTK
jgi:hypothetical protein